MPTSNLHPNEIRDYINRAPKRWEFRGHQMVNNTFPRLVWLSTLARGTLNERINRRAGITDSFVPWKFPIGSAIRRHRRNILRKMGTPSLRHRV